MDNLGAKILSNINSCFLKDPLIDEFDIVGSLHSKSNQNPVVLIEHKLGVEFWAVQVLFQHAYSHVSKWMVSSPRQINSSNAEDLCSWTRAALMVLADLATAWNIRKELVERKWLTVEQDCSFTNLVLTKHPKSSETFAQKKWLLLFYKSTEEKSLNALPEEKVACSSLSHQIIDQSSQQSLNTSREPGSDLSKTLSGPLFRLLRSELESCDRAAHRYPSNYYAWSHRIWLILHFCSGNVQMALEELRKNECFVTSHVSDHSGWHFRQFLLGSLRPAQQQANLLQAELDMNTDLISRYSGHEALWYHRRFIVQQMNQADRSAHRFDPATSDASSEAQGVPKEPHKGLVESRAAPVKKRRCHGGSDTLQQELAFADDTAKREEGSWQSKLAYNHTRWLQIQFPAHSNE